MPVVVKARENENSDSAAVNDPRSLFRILVAEDNNDLRRVTTALLTSAGYTVDEVEDGMEAWQAVESSTYDLILTDNSMPRMTGIDLLHKLHSSRRKIPAILITGEIPTDELSRYPWLQIEAIVLKPFTAVALLTVVENIFNSDFAGVLETTKVARRMGKSINKPAKPAKRGLSSQHRRIA